METLYGKSDEIRNAFSALAHSTRPNVFKLAEDEGLEEKLQTTAMKYMESTAGLEDAVDDLTTLIDQHYVNNGEEMNYSKYWTLISRAALGVYGYTEVGQFNPEIKYGMIDGHPLAGFSRDWREVDPILRETMKSVLKSAFGTSYENEVNKFFEKVEQLIDVDTVDYLRFMSNRTKSSFSE